MVGQNADWAEFTLAIIDRNGHNPVLVAGVHIRQEGGGGQNGYLSPQKNSWAFNHFSAKSLSTGTSPDLPGQHLMMLEYRVPVYRNAPGISDAVD